MSRTLIEGVWVQQENDAGWCQCSKNGGGCGRTFTGLSGFDTHFSNRDAAREDSWICLTDEELHARGLRRNPRGWWVLDDPIEEAASA